MIITLATYFYQVSGFAVEKEYTNHGFPFAWLEEGWGGFIPTPYSLYLWSGLLFDVIFWSIIAFVIIVMIKVSIKSRRS